MRGRKTAGSPKVVRNSGEDDDARRPKITDEHKREAAALKKLFEDFQAKQAQRGVKVTQASFAVDNQIGTTQGLVWQYLNARIPLNLRAASRFASGLGCRIDQFSSRLAEEQALLAPQRAAGKKTALESVLELNPLEQQLLGLYRDLPPDLKHDLLMMANEMYSKTHDNPSPANPFGGKKKPVKEER